MRLHHVQVACPPGGEDDARRFYAVGLGMSEVAKPTALGYDVDLRERHTFPRFERFHTVDGAGNRVEVLSPQA